MNMDAATMNTDESTVKRKVEDLEGAEDAEENGEGPRSISEIEKKNAIIVKDITSDLRLLEKKEQKIGGVKNNVLVPLFYSYQKKIGETTAHELVMDFVGKIKLPVNEDFVGGETYEILIVFFLDFFEVLNMLQTTWLNLDELKYNEISPKFVHGTEREKLEKNCRFEVFKAYADSLATELG